MEKSKLWGLVLIGIIGLIVIVGPKGKELIKSHVEIKEKEKQIIKEKKIINNYQKQLKQVENPGVKEGTATEYLVQVEEIISNLNLELEDFFPQEQQRKGKFKLRPISLSLTGNYQNLVSFFNQLEQLKWATKVKKISLTSIQNKLQAEVELLLYNLSESRENYE